MDHSLRIEIAVSAVLILSLLALANPMDIFMPSAFAMTLIAVFAALFAVFASLVWREHPTDEREGLHRLLAGRAGFLAGSLMLALGIVVQSVRHDLDIWLPMVLGVMILAKVAGFIYGRKRL